MNHNLPLIGIGWGFSVITFSTDRTAVGALGFCLLYSSIERTTETGARAGVEDETGVGVGVGALATAALIAATVGEGANDWSFCSQQWGPTVQPSILLNSSQSYTRLFEHRISENYFWQQDHPFEASWKTGGAVW